MAMAHSPYVNKVSFSAVSIVHSFKNSDNVSFTFNSGDKNIESRSLWFESSKGPSRDQFSVNVNMGTGLYQPPVRYSSIVSSSRYTLQSDLTNDYHFCYTQPETIMLNNTKCYLLASRTFEDIINVRTKTNS